MRALSLVAVALVTAIAGSGDARANPITTENSRPGTTAWDVPAAQDPQIEAYSSEVSAAPGQSFHLHVDAPVDSRYRIELYRLGWYGGSGGRRVACQPACGGDEPARPQPAAPRPDPHTGIVDAGWRVTDVIRVGDGWVSGYYLAVLRVTAGAHAGAVGRLPLVVRAATGDRARGLVQVPVNTWQAYNPWGGKSLYPSDSGRVPAGVKVSFNRPYSDAVPIPVGYVRELPLVRFLEREGYDLAYTTDVDIDRRPAELRAHPLVISAGHSEYWSGRTRAGWDDALRHGTNLAVMGANTGFWRTRYENHHRTLVVYRNRKADPHLHRPDETRPFRSVRRPECQLFGAEYEWYAQQSAQAPHAAYTVVASSTDPWLRGTGLGPGDSLPGLVGYEWDAARPHCAPGKLTDLFHASVMGVDHRNHPADAVRVVTRFGSRVFASGSLDFSWGLDTYGGHTPQPRLQQFMRNVLDDLIRPR